MEQLTRFSAAMKMQSEEEEWQEEKKILMQAYSSSQNTNHVQSVSEYTAAITISPRRKWTISDLRGADVRAMPSRRKTQQGRPQASERGDAVRYHGWIGRSRIHYTIDDYPLMRRVGSRPYEQQPLQAQPE